MKPKPLLLLLADDEPLARDLVRSYAAPWDDLEIAGECSAADELEGLLRECKPDVLLLDVRMPGRDVFEVVHELCLRMTLPFIIFATAFDTYAVRAFELNAVDYLVKPFTPDRFVQAIRRVRERMAVGSLQNELAGVLRDLGPRPDRLLVPDGQRMIPIALSDIMWIRAEGDYSRLHTSTRSYLVSRTLKELENRLDPNQFIRIHRSAIVRSDSIRVVRAEGSSRFRVELADGTALIVSRTRSQVLRRWML